MTRVTLDHVNKSFPIAKGQVRPVLRDVCLEISGTSFTSIVGANGCGKSTLLSLIAGLHQPDSGRIEISTGDGRKPRIGFVWQDYRASLMPYWNVAENIALPLRIQGISRNARCEQASVMLQRFSDRISPHRPCYELSGGQQQLISILRSVIAKPDIFLLDEPFSALDQPTKWSMAFLVEQLWIEQAIPGVLVSHDPDEAILLADRVLLMSRHEGHITASIENPLPRPRNVQMLTSTEHNDIRRQVIEFLCEDGAVIRDTSKWPETGVL